MDSEQVSLESFAEAVEQLCGPGRMINPNPNPNPMMVDLCFARSDGGTRSPAEVVELTY